MSKVQRIQELRRSNAAVAIPGKRAYDLPWQDDWEDDDELACIVAVSEREAAEGEARRSGARHRFGTPSKPLSLRLVRS